MRIGVIGVRSKHLAFFRQALGICYPDGAHVITHVWSQDAPELLADHPGLIPCATAQELICAVDAVVIALREGYTHAALAALCLKAGKPVFVDKPFTCSDDDARAIASLAQETGVPCTGGSTICMTKKAQQLKYKLPRCGEYTLSYQADPFSPFGGWYFYGSHLTDMCVTLFGADWESVQAHIEGDRVSARILYPGFSVILRSSPEPQPFLLQGETNCQFDDIHCYEAGMQHFCRVALGQEPGCTNLLVSSVRLLNAVLEAAREGQPYPG